MYKILISSWKPKLVLNLCHHQKLQGISSSVVRTENIWNYVANCFDFPISVAISSLCLEIILIIAFESFLLQNLTIH